MDIYTERLDMQSISNPRPARRSQNPARGFTILELLAVIAIIAILGTIVTINLVGAQDKARITKSKADMKTIAGALDLYRGQYGIYPPTGQLGVLVTENIIKNVPKDAWQREFGYFSPGSYGGVNYDFILVSGGPDQNSDTDDLVRRSTDE